MIKSIEIINGRNEHTTIALTDPRPTGFFIVSVDGLEAPKGTINMIERSRLNGSTYNGSRANARNIVLDLRYFWGNLNNESTEAIRHKTYRMCPIGENVRIIVHTDMRDVYFNGYVESNEINILSKFEQSQISILCEDAYGKGKNNFRDGFSGIEPLFEFPFENASLTEPTIEFGEVYIVDNRIIDYNGEVRTGFTLRAEISESLNGLTITNVTSNQKMKLNKALDVGDVLVICTEQRKKSVTLNGNNIIGDFYTNASNEWVELLSGNNYITVKDGSETGGVTSSLITIECPLLYMGV